MAKRSPIAGYNHNVRYRGLIFHVQTEDSGQASPHLFTHMFYGGVIISTRKLVYDAGSAEDAIKGLMQSQHKVVLRDLKRGMFDDKIDQYLAGTEGLLPRGQGDEGERPMTAASPPLARPQTDVPRESSPVLQVRMSEPEITLERAERSQTEHDSMPELVPLDDQPPPPQPILPRTRTAERKSAPGQVRGAGRPPPPPPLEDLDPPTLNDSTASMAAAIAAANATVRTPIIMDSGPQIQIELEPDEDDAIELPRRSNRDTAVETPTDVRTQSDGVPGQIGASHSGRAGADSIQPLPPPPHRGTGDRGNAVGAATLPPARPIARPPSRQAIPVTSRPQTNDEARTRGDSNAEDMYAPVPVDPAGDRSGQYAQHKRVSQRVSIEAVKSTSDRSGAIPSGLARPGRSTQSPPPGSGGIPQQSPRDPKIQTQPLHSQASRTPTPASGSARMDGRPARARTPTPARVSASGPSQSRAPSSQSGGVVMTRPAVIVGAPAKTAAPKVRKAREEEGRGFGQGLISEKSLDEVILAYLSEDADDK
ncbi:MAG: hypothetical protein H0T42_03655 [Deltaproteobacteria bacterium]|nr:hypothetical protein [Deltaproteobacteria bacterium]